MNSTTCHAARYVSALRAMPASGGNGCHVSILGIANHGRLAGMTAEQVFADIRGQVHGNRPVPDSEIRDAIRKAFDSSFAAPLTPKARPHFDGNAVRDRIIRAGAGVTEADLWEQFPIRLDWPDEEDSWRALSFLFAPEEFVFIGDDAVPGELGRSIRPIGDWIEYFRRHGACPFPKVMPNPLTGALGSTKAGKPSFRADSCIAAHRFTVCEFDSIPLEEQFAFWYACPKLPIRAAGRLLRTTSAGKYMWSATHKTAISGMVAMLWVLHIDLPHYEQDQKGYHDGTN